MQKFLNLILIISSFYCYLDWERYESSFLYEIEYSLFFKTNEIFHSFLNMVFFIPLCGQGLLTLTLFQKKPNRQLSLVGMLMVSVIVLLILALGVTVFNIQITLSTVPFILTSIFFLRFYQKKNRQRGRGRG